MIKMKFRNVFNKVVFGLTGCLAAVGLACSFTIKASALEAATVSQSDHGRLSEDFSGMVWLLNDSLYGYEQNRRWWDDNENAYKITVRDEVDRDYYWDAGYMYVPFAVNVEGISYVSNYPVAYITEVDWLRFDVRVFNSGGNSSISNFVRNIGVVPFVVGCHLYGSNDNVVYWCGGSLKAPTLTVLRGNNINLPNSSDWSIGDIDSYVNGPLVWQTATCSTDGPGPYYFGFNRNAMFDYLGPLVGSYASSVYVNDVVGSAYQNGYNTAKAASDSEAYSKGYQDGVESVSSAGAVMMSLFGSVVSVPINVMNGMSGFMIWGVPIISIIISFLFIGLLIWVVKRFIS